MFFGSDIFDLESSCTDGNDALENTAEIDRRTRESVMIRLGNKDLAEDSFSHKGRWG